MASKRNKNLYEHLPLMPIADFEEYMKEVDLGYIDRRTHPEDDDIIILNYSRQATYDRRWNKWTMSARGLILDTKDKYNGIIYILGRPFDKFFNVGENPDYEEDIPFHEEIEIYEKMDGSLGVSYFINNEVRFASRGSFESPMAEKANEIWRKKYLPYYNFISDVHVPVTYIVEIIYPENKIVVDYGDKEDLVMLGINHLTNECIEMGYEEVKEEAEILNMPLAYKYFGLTLSDLILGKQSLSVNNEGWVIRFANGKRLKVKGDEYVKMHKIVFGLTNKRKVFLWSTGEWDKTIVQIDEEYREEYELFGKALDRLLDVHVNLIEYLYEKALESSGGDKKKYAEYVKEVVPKEFMGVVFHRRTGSLDGVKERLKEYMFNNYKEQLELAQVWMKKDKN